MLVLRMAIVLSFGERFSGRHLQSTTRHVLFQDQSSTKNATSPDLNRAQAYDDFLIARIPRVREREDRKDESFIFKSGETMRRKGRSSSKVVSMPRMDEDFRVKSEWAAMSKKRHRFVKTKMRIIDCGYAECNNIDWGYVR